MYVAEEEEEEEEVEEIEELEAQDFEEAVVHEEDIQATL